MWVWVGFLGVLKSSLLREVFSCQKWEGSGASGRCCLLAYSSGKSRAKHSGEGLCQFFPPPRETALPWASPAMSCCKVLSHPGKGLALRLRCAPMSVTSSSSWTGRFMVKNQTGSLCLLALPSPPAAILNPCSSLSCLLNSSLNRECYVFTKKQKLLGVNLPSSFTLPFTTYLDSCPTLSSSSYSCPGSGGSCSLEGVNSCVLLCNLVLLLPPHLIAG